MGARQVSEELQQALNRSRFVQQHVLQRDDGAVFDGCLHRVISCMDAICQMLNVGTWRMVTAETNKVTWVPSFDNATKYATETLKVGVYYKWHKNSETGAEMYECLLWVPNEQEKHIVAHVQDTEQLIALLDAIEKYESGGKDGS